MIVNKIDLLRKKLNIHQIDAYLVSCNDEYLSEYVASYSKRLEFLTGFTGSSGLAIIGKDFGYFFTDGRYIEQCKNELDLQIFEIINIQSLNVFLHEKFDNSPIKIGYDAKLFSHRFILSLRGINLLAIADNLIDAIWPNQPKKPNSRAYSYPQEFSGKNYADKLTICHQALEKYRAKYLIIAKADSICWLLNIRGNDIDYCPVILGTLVVGLREAFLFTDISRIDEELSSLMPDVKFCPENQLEIFLTKNEELVLIDENNTNNYIINSLKHHLSISDPTIYPRGIKNQTEISQAINSHIYDAVALIEFLSHLNDLDLSKYTEYDLATILTNFRGKQPLYVMDSFGTICGYKENGSIIHYQPKANKSKYIEGAGLLLIDSGGQYFGGTTDITRTIAIGKAKPQEKYFYTKVLKGYIALANIKFPSGISGANLDVLARQYLWEEGKDYAHGTGHGVGSFLNVHEGPQNINRINTVSLVPGMILSNEPGYYSSGNYGIRIESLMYVAPTEYVGYFQFNILSLVPFDKTLINFAELSKKEIEYMQNYYTNINEKVAPLLSAPANKWLAEQLKI